MLSWRETVSPQVQLDLDNLFNEVVDSARANLQHRGGFYPFAGVVCLEGRPQEVVFAPSSASDATGDGANEPRDVNSVMDECVAALMSLRPRIRAGALTYDVRGERLDAIRVDLEHRDGPSFTAFVPYRRIADGSRLVFETVQAQTADSRLWREGRPTHH